MISTEASSRVITSSDKHSSDLVCKPEVIDIYNQTMNGVDLADQFTVCCGIVHKSHKWWRNVFFGNNHQQLYLCKTANPTISHLQFRNALV